MYLDGVKLAKVYDEGTGGPSPFEAAMQIAVAYTGLLDEMAIYDHALAADRIQAHRTAAGRCDANVGGADSRTDLLPIRAGVYIRWR